MGFRIEEKISAFGDLQRSRSNSENFEVEYLENGTR